MPPTRQRQTQRQKQQPPQTRQQQFQSLYPANISRQGLNQVLNSQSVLAQQPFKTQSPIPSNIAPSPYAGVVGVRPSSPQYFLNERLFEIELNVIALHELNKFQSQYGDRKTTEQELYHDVRALVYDEALLPLLRMINNPDESIVPKDTGRLRNAILLSIQGGGGRASGSTYTRIGNLHPFSVILNTGKVRYAAWVNPMPESWVQHTGQPHANAWHSNHNAQGQSIRKYKPKQKPHALYDPNAKQDFFGKLVDEGQKIFEQMWYSYIHIKFADRFDHVIHKSYMTLDLIAMSLFRRVR